MSRKSNRRGVHFVYLLGLLFSLRGSALLAGNWPQFRGPNLSGIGQESGLPERWGPTENIAWKAELPGRGVSSPIVVGKRVYVTANSGMARTRLHILCFDADNGKKLWERQFWATASTHCNPKTCMAAPTPVADGQHVYVLFGTCDLICLTTDGDVVWIRSLWSDYPQMTNHVGRGSSPVLCEDVLIVAQDNEGAAYLLGLDTRTGQNRWKVERPAELSYTTPLIVRRKDQSAVIVQSARGLDSYNPATGAHLWNFQGGSFHSIASPVLADDLILAPARGLAALRLGESGPPKVLWQTPRLSTVTATPLAADGRVYTLKGEILVCGRLTDGKEIWSQRLKGAFSASPVLADGKLYVVNEDGVVTVLRPEDKPDILASNDMRDPMLATPAVANGSMYLRSDRYLYCVRQGNARGQENSNAR